MLAGLKGKKNLLLSIFFILSFSGCDKLSALVNSFSRKPTPQQDVTALAPAQAGPAAGSAVPSTPPLSPDTLVKVGNWKMTKEEFKDRLGAVKEFIPDFNPSDREAKKFVLEEIVKQQLLVEEAERRGLGKNKDVMAAVEEFQRTLLVRELATELTKGVQSTDVEAEEYYNQNKTDFVVPGEWHIREIRVETEDEAKKILVDVLQGADFADAAKQHSKAPSAAQGGDVGSVNQFPFPEMEGIVKVLDAGGVSSVFKGPDGYYIVKVEEKKGGGQKEFAEIKEEIKAGLVMLKQQQAVLGYLDQLRKNATVEINEKLLEE